MPSKPISVTQAQTLLRQRAKLLTDVSDALSGGPPINWKTSDRVAYTAQLRSLGFHLVTKGQARAHGLDIPPGTQPVGRGEFGPPLSQFLDLYILEIQATELVEELPPEAIQVSDPPAQPTPVQKKVKRHVRRAPAVAELKPKVPSKTAQVQWLTATEAADYLGMTSKAMQTMRYQHTGPAYQRNGSNVMYKSADLDAWLAAQG